MVYVVVQTDFFLECNKSIITYLSSQNKMWNFLIFQDLLQVCVSSLIVVDVNYLHGNFVTHKSQFKTPGCRRFFVKLPGILLLSILGLFSYVGTKG